jgi:signal peptidase I
VNIKDLKSKIKPILKETVETIIFVVVAIVIIRFFLCEIRWIPSASMKPTLIEGDRVLVERLTRFFSSPSRGDVMIFYPPQEKLKNDLWSIFTRYTGFFCKDIAYIKRVIGLPREKIEIVQNKDGSTDVLINDKAIEEHYIKDKYEYPICTDQMYCGPITLGEDEYFMMGDNRGHSADSRYWGVLKKDRFIGKAKVLFRAKIFPKENYDI